MDLAAAPALPSPRTLGSWTRGVPVSLAILGTGLVLGAAYALVPAESRAAELVLRRGAIQLVTLALFFWGLGHILRRWLLQAGERRALAAAERMARRRPLSREDVPLCLRALEGLRDSLAGPVLGTILGYFRTHRPTRDELLEAAGAAVDRAYDRVEADYRALGATLWLLPLSGFLGTVIGMAEAIASFDGVIGGTGGDLTALAPAVAGLAKAFDTTLLALALVVPLKLLEVWMQGRDRRLLEAIDGTLGAGFVADLDLAMLAQQSPAEALLEEQAETFARIEHSLRRIDLVLASIGDRLASQPAAVFAALESVPAIKAELQALREQGEQPMVITRKDP